jgi:hypothetical protein
MNPHHFLVAPLLVPTLCSAAEEASGTSPSLLEHPGFDLGYQLYQEDDERIKVESWYFRGNIDVVEGTVFRYQLLEDTITGASPTGMPAGNPAFLKSVTDARKGLLAAIDQQVGDHTVSFEFSRSEESDYLSYGYALSDKWELNQKNTTLSYGINYLDDDVSVVGMSPQRKEGFDLFAGLSQVLDKHTTVTANLTFGWNNGYLNDPYKLVPRSETVPINDGLGGVIDVPVTASYGENRPDERFRQVLQLGGNHWFEPARGAADLTYRLSNDDYGVLSHTLIFEWRQMLGDKFLITPYCRYYRQNAADFFTNSLDTVVPFPAPIPPIPDGSAPNYSADYRLSSLETFSIGLRVQYEFSRDWSASLAYERYAMNGRGSSQSPAAAYPDADIWSFVLSARF